VTALLSRTRFLAGLQFSAVRFPSSESGGSTVRRLQIEGLKSRKGRVGQARLHPRLLIVHPNPFSADVLATVLAPLRLDCYHAENNWAAVRWLGEHPSPLLATIDPAAADCLGLVAFTRRLQPDYPVVALFSPSDEACESEVLRIGAAGVLNYPGPPDEIRAAIAGALFLNRPKRLKVAGDASSCDDDDDDDPTHELEANPNVHPLKEELESHERNLIENALRTLGWNRGETAKALGIERTTLFLKMRKYGLLEQGGPGSTL
jgi:DNA-binding NtrC family response regulator